MGGLGQRKWGCSEGYHEGAKTFWDSSERETQFPVFMCMIINAKTHKKVLIDLLRDPNDRVLEISALLGYTGVGKVIEESFILRNTTFHNSSYGQHLP